jgi:transposase
MRLHGQAAKLINPDLGPAIFTSGHIPSAQGRCSCVEPCPDVFIVGCGLRCQDHLRDSGYRSHSDIGPTVLTEWRFAFAGLGLSFLGLKDYSQRQDHLGSEQERATQAHFTECSARNADEICAYNLAEHGQNYSASGAAKLMRRLGFAQKKPWSLPAQATRPSKQPLSPSMRP